MKYIAESVIQLDNNDKKLIGRSKRMTFKVILEPTIVTDRLAAIAEKALSDDFTRNWKVIIQDI